MVYFDKNGFFYIFDCMNMELVCVVLFVDCIDWGEVDEKGNVMLKVFFDKEGDLVYFWLGSVGVKEWMYVCYSLKIEFLYVFV